MCLCELSPHTGYVPETTPRMRFHPFACGAFWFLLFYFIILPD
ncbi:hypothetical protein RUMCAL_01879 [Ruminococcus callidus ATCC 27760]|uniref:Uncharacterized protein n=1 Tax=Ruminococcus callidus ATCC 27760 TaxID=411473 RepID=U2KRT2_9FIRM|nr:hypothetical protein RUMCAL_01879 [Ruminococcus callidus ATCC 27760]